MARYEIYDDGVASFWDITLSGRTYTVRWGRVPSRGQSQVKHFDDEGEARAAYEKQISAKLKKGYRLVKGTEEPEAVVRPPSQDVIAPRNAQLEAAAQLDPNDEGPLLVLGDWLQSQGDPRGELLALQVAQKKKANDPTGFVQLKKAIDAHYAAHEAALLGPVYPARHLIKLEWHLGFIRSARISYDAAHADDPPMREVIKELCELPSAVVLQELALGNPGTEAPRNKGRYGEVLEALFASRQPSTLRTLFLGDVWPGHRPPSPGLLGDLRDLGTAFPKLTRLVIANGHVRWSEVELPKLTSFEHKSEFDADALDWLTGNLWPELTRLTLTMHQPQVQHPFVQKRFPALRQLRLLDTITTRAWLEVLLGSGLLAQLEALDLDDGDLDDHGANYLLEHWASFAHLRTFRLGKQHLSWAAVKRLRELQVNLLDPK